MFENPNLPKLSSEASKSCEGKITIDECQNIIKTFPLGKTPGDDGLPIEFYSAFWSSIAEILIKCFNESHERKEMSNSQRRGVITLTEKTGKDRTYLENWRPIPLTNVDAKIASKGIATRIVKILREIIHGNQTGYVPGRYIREAARSILDVMEYTKTVNISDMLQWWSEFRSKFASDTTSFDSIIWNNCNIRIDGKPICYLNYVNSGVILVSDLMFSLNTIDSFNAIKNKGLRDTNYLTWTGVRCSVPKHLRNLNVDRNVLRMLEFKYGDKGFDPISSKSRNFYALLIQDKAKHSRGFCKIMSNFSLSEEETRKAFLLPKTVAFETFVQCFQFKILNDILFLNSRLAKIGRTPSDLCTFCQAHQETLEHFFYQCPYSIDFWTKFENFWLRITKEQIKLDYNNIILGILDQRFSLLNYCIILGKLYLWKCRKNNQIPFFLPFEEIVKEKYKTEKLIASQNNLALKKFQAKWDPVLNSNLDVFVKD